MFLGGWNEFFVRAKGETVPMHMFPSKVASPLLSFAYVILGMGTWRLKLTKCLSVVVLSILSNGVSN